MQLEEILQLIKAVDETGFDKFELADEAFQLKLERRNYRLALERGGTPLIVGSPGPTSAPVQPVAPAREEMEPAPEKSGLEITSPLIGVFHALPEGKAVKVGDHVKKGEVICMIEAMKLMNEILMPEDGEITEVAVKDMDMVEYGDLLYRYIV